MKLLSKVSYFKSLLRLTDTIVTLSQSFHVHNSTETAKHAILLCEPATIFCGNILKESTFRAKMSLKEVYLA